MANPEHLEILEQGVEVWNTWRKENFGPLGFDAAVPDLRGVKLELAQLGGVDLAYADLGKAILEYCDLDDADLTKARIGSASLRGSLLRGADLRGAILDGTVLSEANLFGARFGTPGALGFAGPGSLRRTDFSGARFGRTTFEDVDLSVASGLAEAKHMAPSMIGLNTIYRSTGGIPVEFLRGAGVPDQIIDYICSLVGNAIEYYSAFISYSSWDEDIAKRLHADLQDNGVRCWFAPEDMKIGDKIRPSIDASIRLHDKLLLVLSDASVASDWVEYEVKRALAREEREGSLVLFPITIDEAVFDTDVAWASRLRDERHIGNFRWWKDHDKYRKAFDRLMRDLKAASE